MKNLVFYITIHYPDRETFFEILELLDQEGAGYVEIGIPVSDPHMDGIVIRQTHKQVLEQKITADDIIHTLEEIRKRFSFRVVLMTYKEGVKRFRLSEVSENLYDGFLCVDGEFPPEILHDQISVLGGSLKEEDISKALEYNHLFAYVVSGDGKTGSFDRLPTGYIDTVGRVKAVSGIPAFVGFGIKSAADVREVLDNGADGAIIGTEFIKRYQLGGMEALKTYLAELKAALVS
ncbi:tryptophan synthase subunit alpha [Lachnospiraceae bacterium 54-53]